ncbi:MAG: hypothetical protein N3F05_04425 [Candidatus Diapherotrites archaeon]|nr:hypothetical protein [Candidatus Diapherotrites archaeon]
MKKGILPEEKAQGDWSAVYLILVFAIVALLIIYIIKPMYQNTQKIVTKTTKSVTS